MAGSTCVAARKRLLALIAADSRIDASRVFYAWPGDQIAGGDLIYCIGIDDVAVEDIALKAGRRRRQERYTLIIGCSYVAPGGTQEAAMDRAIVLMSIVEEVVADNPTLAGASLSSSQQIISATETGWEALEGQTGTGHGAGFAVRVEVEARLL